MKIKLLKDHQGAETNNSWFVKGTILEYEKEDPMAEILLKNGWAEKIIGDVIAEKKVETPLSLQRKRKGAK